jgi:FdhD protein
MSELAAVEEVPVWLEVNNRPVVTWMCTPELLEELAIGWLHGEGYIDRLDEVRLRPCATDLGFWAEVPAARVAAVQAEGRRPVLASGCGAVSTFLAEPGTVQSRPPRGEPPELERLRRLFKALFARGTRYKDTGGIHAAALTDGEELIAHAEDIGRHNAVDKAIGGALLAGRPVAGLGLLVTGRISAELAFKAARAGLNWVATPSVPSTLAV